MKTTIKKDSKIVSKFIFTEKELIDILVDYINLNKSLPQNIRSEDCVFKETYDEDYKIESWRNLDENIS